MLLCDRITAQRVLNQFQAVHPPGCIVSVAWMLAAYSPESCGSWVVWRRKLWRIWVLKSPQCDRAVKTILGYTLQKPNGSLGWYE